MSRTELPPAAESDARLDAALAALLNLSPPDDATVERVRATVFPPAGSIPTPRRRRRWVGVAVVAAATALGLLVPSLLNHGGSLQNTAAADTLAVAAAAAITSADPVVGPGQYLYVHEQSTRLTQGEQFTWTWGYSTAWIPSTRTEDWLFHSGGAFPGLPLTGLTPPPAAAFGDVLSSPPVLAPCGDRYGFSSCTGEGSWAQPSLTWIEALPTDPAELYAQLSDDSAGKGRSDAHSMLTYAEDALRSGLVPADKRAAIYLAVGRIPGLSISDTSATLDGRTGTAFSIEARGVRQDVIIDPATGQYIGGREVLTEPDLAFGLPVGLVTESSSVITAVVDGRGLEPR